MTEAKDPKIKLFGKTIELPETSPKAAAAAVEAEADVGGAGSAQSCDATGDNSSLQDLPSSSSSMLEDRNLNRDTEEQESGKKKDILDEKQDDGNKEDQSQPLISDKPKDSQEKTEEDQSETSNSQEKTLKKPDKILPCPRCNSMDTKFCYFNNYNVNQPRHFCKNCQRYWTAGGTMRNVPVGAGRRKNKNTASHFRHVTIPEAHPNGLLNFRPDTPLCESMVSVSIIADRAIRNGAHKPDEMGISISGGTSDQSSGILKDEVGNNCHGPYPNQVPCFPGGPWAYPWSPVQWGPANVPMPAPFYPTPPYWGCAVPGPWWVVPPTAASNQTPPSSGPNSPTLGKHSRDDTTKPDDGEEEGVKKESNPEKCLWVPKTLRIDDPGDAAKSSIWATLGIKNDSSDSVGGGTGLFKAFKSQSKDDEKTPQVSGTSTVLQANPAAFSRSLNFHENS